MKLFLSLIIIIYATTLFYHEFELFGFIEKMYETILQKSTVRLRIMQKIV